MSGNAFQIRGLSSSRFLGRMAVSLGTSDCLLHFDPVWNTDSHKGIKYLEQSVSTSNMINQYQSLDPVNSCRFHQLRHQKHCLEILDVIQYSGHKLASECPLRYFVLGGTGIWGFVDMSATKRVQQTPESVFPQLLLPYSPPTLDKYLGRP